jgi:hypothetical protein
VLTLSGAVCSRRDAHGRDHGGDPAGEFGRFVAARLEVLGGWVGGGDLVVAVLEPSQQFRVGEEIVVTPYLRFFIGSNSPTFEFRSDQAPKMFTRYARHFENTWNLAEDWTS